MSRSRIEVELKGGIRTPRERIWDAMLKLDGGKGKRFTKGTVQDHCAPMVLWSAVDDYFDALEAGGYLKRVGGGPRKGEWTKELECTLTKRPGQAPRINKLGEQVVQGSGTEAMWRAMKVLPTFDYKDIARAASLGTLVVNESTAKSYVVMLARAGYLTVVKASKPGTPARHRLFNNTGMYAPAITRKKVVFDRNTGKFADLQTPQEVCDSLGEVL